MSILTKLFTHADPGSPGTPGTPSTTEGGSPPVSPKPAYCITVPVYYPMTYGYTFLTDPHTGQIVIIPYSTGPKTVMEQQCYPATPGSPGVPGTVIPGTPGIPPVPPKPADYNIGWNASARSLVSLTGNGQYQFSVSPDAVGVVTGLNDVNNGSAYAEIDFALYCATGQFRVMEGGAEVGVSGSFMLGDLFTIARVGDVVQYFQNTTLLYASKKRSTGTVFADSSLYFGGDQITSASLTNTVDVEFGTVNIDGNLTGVLTGLRGYFSDTGAAAWRNDALGNMVADFREDGNRIAQLTGVLPSMEGEFVAPDAYALQGVMDGMGCYFESGLLQPSFAAADLTLQNMSGFAIVTAGMAGVLTGGLGNLRGFMSNAPPGGYLKDGDPPPLLPGTVAGSSTLFHDTYTGAETLDVHHPEIGALYIQDGGAPLSVLVLSGGHLPIGDNAGNGFDIEQAVSLAGMTSITVKQTVQIDAINPGDSIYIDTALDKRDTDDWLYEMYLEVQLDGTIHLSGYIYSISGTQLYGAANEPDVTSVFTLGVPHTITMEITPDGVVWKLDGVEVDNSGGVLSDVPLDTATGLEMDMHSSGAGTTGFLDEATLLLEAAGIQYDIDPNGDWIGRSGNQLRMMIGFFIDKASFDAGAEAALGIVRLPSPLVVDGHITPAGSMVGSVTLPAPMRANIMFGWKVETTLPMQTMDIGMTFTNAVRAAITLPMLSAQGSGTVGTLLETVDALTLPSPLAVTGKIMGEADAEVVLPALTAAGRIVTDIVAAVQIRLPALAGGGHIINPAAVDPQNPAGRTLQGHVVLPALRGDLNRLEGDLWLPRLQVGGHATAVTGTPVEARIGYAMNLKTGAVTEFTNYPFRAMGRAYNMYWGVGLDGNLYRMGGDLDDTAPIDWEWLSGMNDFAVWGQKGVMAVYLRAVFENGATVTLQTDDEAIRVYDHVAAGDYKNAQVHRVPLGRGIRTDSMAFGMANPKGGYLELDKVTPEYVIVPRNL